ncbi:DUF6145 family protein [Lachnobacterium bovis]|uniref:Uncharacterized protein n=1 Tax=Lachnobacterium bovis DSM 14045 TaxID=1122142 RepID=A0A1H3K3A8_9FIRM|nr:DUF6145 family protein [Lachnobacterium bovis]SDY46014.1 hypothetical protein SAMN02910414_01615 [Lachnobacterium bovis DSM 14045]
MDMSKNNIEDTKDEVVLCGASAYNKKYYLNENFMGLPDSIKEELRIMCVLYTEEIGGILQLVFDEKGNLEFKTSSKEGDLLYDDIGSILKIKQLQKTKVELLESVELYHRILFLGEGFDQEE